MFKREKVVRLIISFCLTSIIGGCGGSGGNLAKLKPPDSFPALGPPRPALEKSTAEILAEIASLDAPGNLDQVLFGEMKTALAQWLKEHHPDRVTRSAPSGDAGSVTKIYVSQGVLRWTYESRGDCDANGEVNVNDITPLVIHFNDVVGDGDGDIADAWVDADTNGEVNLADITTIVINYFAQCSGYKVLTAADPEGPFTELGLVAFGETVLDSYPPSFQFDVPQEAQAWLLVQPFDDANQVGALSIAVPSAGGGQLAYFEGPEGALLTANLPDLPVQVPPDGDFNFDDDPRGTGLATSFTKLNIVFTPDTTIGEANAALAGIGASVAGTLPVIGLVVAQIPEGGGFAALHDALDKLSQNAKVATAVQDTLLGSTVLNHPSASEDPTKGSSAPFGLDNPNPWWWDFPPKEISDFNGNWGMEAIRAPQAWNLADHARRGSGPPRTMVFDLGFNDAHPDGEMANLALFTTDGSSVVAGHTWYYHGMHISGTIGAEHYNNVGVAGLNPLLSDVTPSSEMFIAFTMREASFNSADPFDSRQAAFSSVLADINMAASNWPDTKVVNLSLGYNWYKGGSRRVNANITTEAQDVCSAQGRLFRLIAFVYDDLIYVAAAGNDSGTSNGFPEEMEAVWASPFCWAGLSPDIAYPGWVALGPSPNIVVVESASANVANSTDPPNAWDYMKSDFSNMGGHVAAPGSDILSCVGDNFSSGYVTLENYESLSGTSMASPHVTGLISYLATVDPTLTQVELVSLVTGAGYTTDLVLRTGDLTPAALATANDRMIDAFAAVIGIDSIQGSRGVQLALVDVDDGTWDGNYREDLFNTTNTAYPVDPDPDMIHTLDMRRGDGVVTMKDFRAYRDAYVAAHYGDFPIGLSLDGTATHFKKDLNFDGAVFNSGTSGWAANPPHPVDIPSATVLNKVVPETMYPRYDFNGDGEVGDWAQTAPYRIDPATPAGSDETTAVLSPPGMLRDIDVLATTGFWQSFDTLSGQPGSDVYWEYVVNLSAQEGVVTSQHWSPARYLLGNRDSGAAVDPAFQRTPDYLHSADLHFALDWSRLGISTNEIIITITSPIDGVVDDFVRRATFTPDDPWKFVVTIPIWTSEIEVAYDAGNTYRGSKSFTALLGQDIAVGLSNFMDFPPYRWDIPQLIPRFEPVFWIRSFGPGEGWIERTLGFGPYQAGIGHDLIFAYAETGVQQGTAVTVATLANPQLMAGGEIFGNPAFAVDDGEGKLMFYHSTDNGSNWDVVRTLDNGAQFDFSQMSFIDFGGEQFVIYSKDNGLGTMTAYYVRNKTGPEFQFGGPVEIGPGTAPTAAIVGNMVMLAIRDPQAMSAPFLGIFDWDPTEQVWNQLAGPPPVAYDGIDGEALTFELFDNAGLPGILLSSSGNLFMIGYDGASWFGNPVGIAQLPGGYEFKPWVRPQAMMLNGRLGCLYRDSYWLADDGGQSWSPTALPLDFGGTVPDADYVRSSFATEIVSMEFYDPANQSMVITTQSFGLP